MNRKTKSQTLYVSLNGVLVGFLKKESSGAISFRYESEWLEEGFAISHSMPLQEDMYRGEIVSRYFDNLLPDNDEIKKTVATKFGAESIRPFDMLSVIGKDCVGALSFSHEEIDPFEQYEMNYKKISEKEIAQRIRELSSSSPLGMKEGEFRLSVAGAQEKTALLKIKKGWHEPQGMTPTTHLIKTPIGALGESINFKDSVDNEWASLAIMKKFGLPVCHSEIEVFEDQRVLVVERFDRRWVKNESQNFLIRIPQEDLCQALGYSPYQKYQSDGGPGILEITKLLQASKEQNDRFDFFKAMIIFDLLYATDGHGKNFSIFLGADGFRLTPFYDVMSGYFLVKSEGRSVNKMKLAMGVGESGHYRFSKIAKRHYLETAKKCGIIESKFEEILEGIRKSYLALSFTKEELDTHLNQKTLEIILEGIEKRARIFF
jgi:serine/threonine-protein kinase HipA